MSLPVVTDIYPSIGWLLVSDTSRDFNVTQKERDAILVVAKVVVLAVILAMALLGNGLVLVVLLTQRQRHNHPLHHYMLNLCVADLAVALFQVLPQLVWEARGRFSGPDFLCRLVKYLQVLGMFASSYMIVAMTLNRHYSICSPLQAHRSGATQHSIFIMAAWGLSLLLSLPQVFIFSQFEVAPGRYECWGNFEGAWGLKAYVTWMTLAIFILPVLIITVCQVRIFREIHKSLYRKSEHHPSHGSLPSFKRDRQKAGSRGRGGGGGRGGGRVGGGGGKGGGGGGCDDRLSTGRSSLPTCVSHLTFSNSTISLETGGAGGREGGEGEGRRGGGDGDGGEGRGGGDGDVGGGGRGRGRGGCDCRHSTGIPTRVPHLTFSNSTSSLETGSTSQHLQPGPLRPNSFTSRGDLQSYSTVDLVPFKAMSKTVRMTLVIVVVYSLCWAPFFSVQMWAAWDPNAPLDDAAFTLLMLLASLNSCTNPWIYAAFSSSVSSALRLLLFCKGRALLRGSLRGSTSTTTYTSN